MRKACFLLVLFLILAIFLNGCSIVTTVIPSINQEEGVKRIVTDYWLALSNRQYGLAKSYCILNGASYRLVEQYQDMPYFGFSTVTFIPYFNWVEITGSSAKANINLTLTATVCFGDICATESETLYNCPIYLARIGGAWKLK